MCLPRFRSGPGVLRSGSRRQGMTPKSPRNEIRIHTEQILGNRGNSMSNLSEVTRRKFLGPAGIGPAWCGTLPLTPPPFGADSAAPLTFAQEAYIWGLPAV